jgi:DNA helicase-2/ATP-dependent DNA helicase PcrA
MEDGIFPSYMTITSDDPTEVEEERRLCYVGITRAEENLTMTCARRRMIRGETQYNKISRFMKEVPVYLLASARSMEKEKREAPKENPYFQARQAFRTQAFAPAKQAKSFGVKTGEKLSYDVGDRVRHMKFGEGLVVAIVEGGRDYEVTVQFDQVGVKKMFASFAKLVKCE